MSNLKVYVAVLGPVGTNCYIVVNEDSKEALIVDAADDAERLLQAVEKRGLTLRTLLLTHAHWDHVGAVMDMLAAVPGLPVYIGENDSPLLEKPGENCSAWLAPQPGVVDRSRVKELKDGDTLELLGRRIRCIEVPGHTAGGMCYYFEEDSVVFAGDTLFQGSIGRSDLPTGDESVLISSIKEKLLCLPDDTRVYPGHGLGTTIGVEKRDNFYLK